MLLDVVVSADGTYQVVPEIVGSLQPSKSKVPTTSFPYKTKTAAADAALADALKDQGKQTTDAKTTGRAAFLARLKQVA